MFLDDIKPQPQSKVERLKNQTLAEYALQEITYLSKTLRATFLPHSESLFREALIYCTNDGELTLEECECLVETAQLVFDNRPESEDAKLASDVLIFFQELSQGDKVNLVLPAYEENGFRFSRLKIKFDFLPRSA